MPEDENVKELTEEEKEQRVRELIQKHQQAYKQRIEEAKVRIRLRGEASRARQVGRPYAYTVRPGETLADIAKTFYADPKRWPEIYEANKDVIADPDAVEAGQTLRIP
jgi:nucleoid-associated protein YgaU